MAEELVHCMCPVINLNWYESVPSWNTISSFHNTLMAQPKFLPPKTIHVPNIDNLSEDQVSGDSPGGRWKESGATRDRKWSAFLSQVRPSLLF